MASREVYSLDDRYSKEGLAIVLLKCLIMSIERLMIDCLLEINDCYLKGGVLIGFEVLEDTELIRSVFSHDFTSCSGLCLY